MGPKAGGGSNEEIGVQFLWEQPQGLDLVHVEHVHLQRFSETVYLTFGQAQFPLGFTAPEEGPASAPIVPVARLSMSRENFYEFAKLFKAQMDVMGPLPEAKTP